MVKINYCPSCGKELPKGSFICQNCALDFRDLINNDHLLVTNDADNSIEFYEGSHDDIMLDETPIFEVDDDGEIEIVIDEEDLIGPDGMPRAIPLEIDIDGDEGELEIEIDGEDSDIIIEQTEDGGYVLKPKISFNCPVCGALVGEDLVCKSCFSTFTLTPDESDDDEE